MKTSELCSLRWSDVDIADRTVQVRFAGGTRTRKVLLPANAIPLLQAESLYRQSSDPVFAGLSRRGLTKPDVSRRSICAKPDRSRPKPAKPLLPEGRPVSPRTVERIVRHVAVAAGLTTKEVNCRTLRRSYAVQCLRDGMDVEKLRDSLWHKYVDSTLAYCRYRTPNRATLWFVGLAPKTGEGKAVGALSQVPLPCTAFPSVLGAIQCSAP